MALINVKKIMYFEKTANMQCGFVKNKSVYCRLAIAHWNFLFSSSKKQLKIPTAKVRATFIHMLKKNQPSKNLQIWQTSWLCYCTKLMNILAIMILNLRRLRCALQKFLKGTQCSCEIQCAWHTTSAMRKLRFSSCPGAKVRHQGPQDIARAQPWVGDV